MALYDCGYIPLPLRKGSKHIDLERLGYDALHFKTKRKLLKELMFDSACLHLSQMPPTRDNVAKWFRNFDGNIGILGGYKGLVVLDFDNGKVFEAWRQKYKNIVANAPIISSPRGRHIFLRCDWPLESSSLYYGFRKAGHLKSLGGYVVTAPSVLNTTKRYKSESLPLQAQGMPPSVGSLAELGLTQISPFKSSYDRVLNRGNFIPE